MSAPSARTLIHPMVQRLDTTAKALNDIANMGDFGQLEIQLIDGSQDGTSAGDLRIRVADHIPGAVIAVMNGGLHLVLQLDSQVRIRKIRGSRLNFDGKQCGEKRTYSMRPRI